MRKIMILGASALQVPGIIQAKKMGLYVIAVDMNPNAVGFKYADKAVVISTIDIPKVVEAAKIMKVDGVITLCTDMPVRTVAAVAEVLGLPAISVDNAYRATDKIKMRETLKECGVPIPYFTMAKNENEFITAVQEVRNLNYKCIVKPADNSGSHGVVLLDRFDIAYLKDVYSYSRFNSRSGDVIVEEFMEGAEVCVETLSMDGSCYPIQITDKLTTGAPYFVEMGHSQPSQLPIDIQEDIKRVAIACNTALGNYNGSSCTEIKVTKDGAKVVEMGARLAGDFMTTDLVPLSCGVNMTESVIKIAMGEKFNFEHKFEKASAIRFLEVNEGIIESISGVESAKQIPGVIRVSIDRKIGDKSVIIRSSLDRIGYVIAQADNPAEAIRICEEAIRKIVIKVKKD
ncbi:ATP-grasp domain-containing protein [Lachnospiraceae bacterium 62-26]|jgi:Biotin carboxylase